MSTEGNYSNGEAAEAANAFLQQIVTNTAQHELDLVYTAVVPVFFTNLGVVTQYYSREKVVYDNTSSTEVSRVTEYSTDAATWSTTVPTGTPAVGTPPITVGIEQGIAPVGEVLTAGVVTGKVFVILTTNEDGTGTVPTFLLVNTDGTTVFPYSGTWQPIPDVELDLVQSVGYVCVTDAGVQTTWMVRSSQTVDNSTGLVTGTATEYSTDGASWSTTVPTGTITAGACQVSYVIERVDLCAINAGVGYAVGDKVMFEFVVNPDAPLVPIIFTAKNLTDGTYPNVVYLQINGVPVLGTLPNFADFRDCSAIPVTETASGTVITNGGTFTLPANVISFTVTAQSGSFDLSFDGGGTFALTGRVGTRTFGDGTINPIANSASIVVQASNPSDIDIIWEA